MKLDPKTTAMLTLDLQMGIFDFAPDAAGSVPNAAKAVEFARKSKWRIIHVGLGFAEGHPEIPVSDSDSPFQRVKQNNRFVIGTPSAEFHGAVFRSGDLVIHKQRVGAFSENHLHLVLRANRIDTLVLFGVATSGIVLSTLRRAFDLDYRCIVLKDACYDPDPEVHRVLTEKVFPRQAKVQTVDDFVAEQGAH